MCLVYLVLLKTLRVTAVSTGDSVIFEQGVNQGIRRIHEETHALPALEGPKERHGGSLVVLRDV